MLGAPPPYPTEETGSTNYPSESQQNANKRNILICVLLLAALFSKVFATKSENNNAKKHYQGKEIVFIPTTKSLSYLTEVPPDFRGCGWEAKLQLILNNIAFTHKKRRQRLVEYLGSSYCHGMEEESVPCGFQSTDLNCTYSTISTVKFHKNSNCPIRVPVLSEGTQYDDLFMIGYFDGDAGGVVYFKHHRGNAGFGIIQQCS